MFGEVQWVWTGVVVYRAETDQCQAVFGHAVQQMPMYHQATRRILRLTTHPVNSVQLLQTPLHIIRKPLDSD